MIDLLLAEQWHIPANEVEERVPALWVERWNVWNIERDRAHNKKSSESLI